MSQSVKVVNKKFSADYYNKKGVLKSKIYNQV
jgi:hypothetical protein